MSSPFLKNYREYGSERLKPSNVNFISNIHGKFALNIFHAFCFISFIYNKNKIYVYIDILWTLILKNQIDNFFEFSPRNPYEYRKLWYVILISIKIRNFFPFNGLYISCSLRHLCIGSLNTGHPLHFVNISQQTNRWRLVSRLK